MQFDVFISHASENKEAVARPLAAAIEALGLRVWLDEVKIGWGDSLSEAIDRGLAQSRYGVVLLSKAFFNKKWTARELSGLVSRQVGEGRIVILPLYVDVDNEYVREKSPPLADQKALQWSLGAEVIADRLRAMLDDFEPAVERADSSIGGSEVVGRVKALLIGGQPIAVEELVNRQTDEALAVIREPSFDLNLRPSDNQGFYDEFRRRVEKYAMAVEELTATLSVIAYYGGAEFNVTVRRALERLGNEPNDLGKSTSGGIQLWIDLRRYPSMLAFYRTACAAIAAERWENLRPLFRDAKVARRPLEEARVPLLTKIGPTDFTQTSSIHWLASDGPVVSTETYTPVEDHLAKRVLESLAWLGIDSHEADRIFDACIFLAQIAYLGVPAEQNRWSDYFSAGRWWRMGRSACKIGSPQADIVESVTDEGDASPILRSGIAPNAATFLERAEKAKDIVAYEQKRR